MAPFDPYHQWLGIPPEQQPANHYRLLGIANFEVDADVIEGASEQRTIYLRTFQTGPNSELAERLLNEVSAARVCLLDGKSKARYDERLEQRQQPPPVSVAAPPSASGERASSQEESLQQRAPWYQTPWVAAGGGAIVMLLIMLMLWPDGTDTTSPGKKVNSQSQQQIDALKQKLATAERAAKFADEIRSRERLTLKGHSNSIRSLSFSPDGRRLASASFDKTVRLWDVAAGTEIRSMKGHTQLASSVSFSPTGDEIAASGYDDTVRLWHATTGKLLATLTGHTSDVLDVAFSPDGKRLASASFDKTVRLWDIAAGNELLSVKEHTDLVFCVAFSPDGTRIVSGTANGSVKLWDAETGRDIFTFKGHSGLVRKLEFSPSGEQLVSIFRASEDSSAKGEVKLWDTVKGEELTLLGSQGDSFSNAVYSPDGTKLALAGRNGTLKLVDSVTGRQLVALRADNRPIIAVAFSPDGKRLASSHDLNYRSVGGMPVSDDNTIEIWNLEAKSATQPTAKFLPPSLKQGLIAYYPFNGNARDESGNDRHAEIKNVVFSIDKHNTVERATYFNGTSSAMVLPDSQAYELQSHSLSVWIKYESGHILASNEAYLKASGFTLGRFDDEYIYTISKGNKQTNQGGVANQSRFTAPVDGWQHLAMTFDGEQKCVYVNGTLVRRDDLGSFKITYDNTPFVIGAYPALDFPEKWFKGSLDDIRIYNRALSKKEVQQLYEYEKVGIKESTGAITSAGKLYPFLPEEIAASLNAKDASFKFLPESDEIGNGKGEFGGKLTRSTKRFEYSVALGTNVSVTMPLHASGKLVVAGQNDLDHYFMLGHFSSTDETTRIGFEIGDGSRKPASWHMFCGQRITYCRDVLEKSRVLLWKYAWLPGDGDYGAGVLRWELDNKKWEYHFREMPLPRQATVDRFGVINLPMPSRNDRSIIIFYLDDVQYSDTRP